MNLFEKILSKTRENFIGKVTRLVAGKSTISDDLLDELESVLIGADVGIPTTLKVIRNIRTRVKKEPYLSTGDLNRMLREEIESLFPPRENPEIPSIIPSVSPFVIMVVGVNGTGKTTTIGKLGKMYKNTGKSVLFGAADTFRAAASEQLKIWGERADIPVIATKMGSDPGAVAFDTVESAVAKNYDIAIIDTAGRLHNKTQLMNELSKIKKVIQKVIPAAPHDTMLVLDGSTGQNAFEQAKQFTEAVNITSITITKLDGTAKGGVIIGISDQFKIPVKYMGTGEGLADLYRFNRKEYVASLFGA
ncbi:MAG: signal recognition particle-docking protein FtsY [Bacteroidetes bacterium]|nr:signal recognition particle-docking protein FtsY [Bacteroidota bacterium]